jgi:Cellulase (glycosyl hydrolase family 5)
MRAYTITTQAAWTRAISCAARRGRRRTSGRFRRYAAPARPVSLAVIVPLAVVALVASSDAALAANASAVPVVHARGSDLQAAGQRWIGFGANYSEVGHDTPVRRAFATAERLGFNQLRVYLPLFSYLRRGDGAVRQRPLRRLQQVLAIAEHDGIYLDLTGDLTWYPQRVPAWYDDASSAERWRVQSRFWRAIAGAAEPANNVLDYELTSEPQAGDSPSWYGGHFADAYFGPYVVRDLAGRPADEWAREWTRTMAAAVRSQDKLGTGDSQAVSCGLS